MKKNFSLRTSHFLLQQGFTLIELLTVIAILGVIGSIVVAILFITLRGTTKSDLLEVARQNGDATLSQVVRGIRYAKSLDTPTSCTTPVTTSSVTVTSLLDNAQTTYSCTANTIASNSASLLDTSALSVSSCSFVCSQENTFTPPTITLQFTLSPKNGNSLAETKFQLPFQSSVTLRNYNQ